MSSDFPVITYEDPRVQSSLPRGSLAESGIPRENPETQVPALPANVSWVSKDKEVTERSSLHLIPCTSVSPSVN